MVLASCNNVITLSMPVSVITSYIYLDFLVGTEKDLDLLVEKGVITNLIGNQGSVAKIVNINLCLGVAGVVSSYFRIESQVMDHYDDDDSSNKSRAIINYIKLMVSLLGTVFCRKYLAWELKINQLLQDRWPDKDP